MRREKQAHGGELIRAEKGDVLNPYGRPTKLVSQVLKDLKASGAEAVTPSQVSDVISVLLNYPFEAVKKIAEDKTLPILIQRTARRFAVSNDKEWDKIIIDSLDRAHGKARQAIEHSGPNGKPIEFNNVSDESLDAALKLLENDNGEPAAGQSGTS